MINIGDLGTFESLPQILNDVLEENIPALEQHIKGGWKEGACRRALSAR